MKFTLMLLIVKEANEEIHFEATYAANQKNLLIFILTKTVWVPYYKKIYLSLGIKKNKQVVVAHIFSQRNNNNEKKQSCF